ncbi:MAG: ATP-binding protein [Myxococcota bacterium]
MTAPLELPTSQLRWTVDPKSVADVLKKPVKSARPGAVGQERAMRALDVGLGIRERGFNIFVVGASGTGRTSTVRHLLVERSKAEPVPPDWVLLYNFDDADRPRAVRLPPGVAHELRKDVEQLLSLLGQELPKAFEGDAYRQRRQRVVERHAARTERRLSSVEKEARRRGFALQRSATGLTLGPARRGEPMSEEEFQSLPAKERARLQRHGHAVEELLDDAVRGIRSLERETDQALADLDRDVARGVVTPLVMEVADRYRQFDQLREHFLRVIDDLVEHVGEFRPHEELLEPVTQDPSGGSDGAPRQMPASAFEGDPQESVMMRYRVNVLVDNRQQRGAPVVEETHPTAFNLLGRIEHRLRGGETVTDFTRIKAGALHRANGGYLLVDAMELLREPAAWDGLKRALKNRALEIEDAGEPGRMISIAALRPEPIPLQVKVVIVGTPDLYYTLSKTDPDFQKLFKVKADFDVEMMRTQSRLKGFASFVVGMAKEEGLKPFDEKGLAKVLEHATRLASDRRKLTARFGEIADLVREASFWATRRKSPRIGARDVNEALEARRDREKFLEERMREAVRDGSIRIETSGSVVGQINGLTVVELGSYSFGHPSRITTRVYVGRNGLVDIEREVDLAGPIHTKGVLILQGLLGDRFGRQRPLRLGATLCMEQSYSDVEGDSASLAEALALLSAIARVPIKQGLAVTGSLDQLGNVQPVGGVNEKIEGFFETCEQQRLTGKQGVVIPAGNVVELMLREDIIQAVEQGRFHVYAVSTVEQAMELLTDVPFGAPDRDGHYPPGTVGHRCERALEELNQAWLRSTRQPREGRTPRLRAVTPSSPVTRAARSARPR